MGRKELPPNGVKSHRARNLPARTNSTGGRFNSKLLANQRALEAAITSSRSPSLHDLRIQLSLDPSVRSISFMESLALDGDEVPVRMIVADRNDGRVAYDIIDKRPYRDIDTQGLLLIALQGSGIRLIEIDSSIIDAEPRAANCRRIWRYRDHPVPAPVIESVVSALARRRRMAIRTLGAKVGLRDPMPTACALICRGLIATNVSKPLNTNSVVSNAADRVTPSLGIPFPT
ncbi:hypothetical protein [Bradyrhizobium tropiciagri]|uniref:hypothetical protein n=1 Tax=Bradyrhizobium tropiciagri TaxID=312253 RepID=UPI000A78AE84|nr:hypothetical protein [Bradyrhizobium tropiciagri]